MPNIFYYVNSLLINYGVVILIAAINQPRKPKANSESALLVKHKMNLISDDT